jgi:predicted dehydrogenase
MSMKSVRLGIIGVGGMGNSHARYLRDGQVPRCELAAVCDINPKQLEAHADLATFTDSRKLIRSGKVDAVIIATPHYHHTTIGVDAFSNGLHVLTEKPISVHKSDCEKMIAAWKAAKKLKFQAMFQLRTVAVYKRIKALVEQGELGTIQRMNWIVTNWFRPEAYYASGGWRATWKGEGGGVLMNQSPHNLDLLTWILGMPSRVQAFCAFGKYHDIEVEDDVTAYLEFPNGATGVFITGTGEAPGTDRLEIIGDRGKLLFEAGRLTFDRNETPAHEFSKNTKVAFSSPNVWNAVIPVHNAPNGHYLVTQNFIDAILDKAPLIAPAEEGIKSVELANAMIYSSLTGKAVDIPLDGKAYERRLKKLIADSKFVKKSVDGVEKDMSKSFH